MQNAHPNPFYQLLALAGTFPKAKRSVWPQGFDPEKRRNNRKFYMRKYRKAKR